MNLLRLFFLTASIVGGLLLGISMPGWAGVEFVTVVKILSNDDHGIIVRSNGEAHEIEKGVGCLSFWRYEGKQVLVFSPGAFLGVGSEVILPDNNQRCRIWNSKELGQWGGSKPEKTPHESNRTSPRGPKSGKCYETMVREPTPFLGNGGEVIILGDGTIWKETSYQYLYLYEYNPSVIVCPSDGKMILGGHIFRLVPVR